VEGVEIMSDAVFSAEYAEDLVRRAQYTAHWEHVPDWTRWRDWYRETERSRVLLAEIAFSPKGWDFEWGGPGCPIAAWIEAQPEGSDDCGTHGAIHALYVAPLVELTSSFELAIHVLASIQPPSR
jgi:hypothetical protein